MKMDNIMDYDFTKPQRYTSENLKSVEYLANDFVKKSNVYLGNSLKLKSLVNISDINQIDYLRFSENVQKDHIIIKISIKPSIKNILIKMDRSICIKLIDIACGGDGKLILLDKELSHIDENILKQVIKNMFKNVNIPGDNIFKVEDVYTYANMISFYSNNESICSIDMKIDDSNLSLNIAYSSIEPILDELLNMNIELLESNTDDIKNIMNNNLENITLELSASLAKIKINVYDLLKLEEGDVIFSDKKSTEDVDIYIEDKKVFKSKVGTSFNKKAIKITEVL